MPLATLSTRIAGTPTQVAVVVAGVVVSAPTFTTPIEDGRAQIGRGFTQDEASVLVETIAAGS